MESSPRTFNSVEDECRYWKERAKQYHKEWTDVKQEYDEYVEQSRQMEAEMDATLDQKQDIIKDLRMRVSSLENENESLKHKFESQSTELTNLEKQLDKVRTERDTMRENMRQLEQKNDDLERAHRILNESIADVGRLLDKAYEKNALLEMEVDEKEALQEKLQRLMDETRDLKQEINVKSRHQVNGVVNTTATNGVGIKSEKLNDMTTTDTSTAAGPIPTDNKRHHQRNFHRNSVSTNLNEYNQQSLKNPENLINGNAMSASSRTNALNIVADMLRKLNLDKAFLCPQCDRFRCVCERPPSSTPTPSISSNSTTADSSIKRLSRSLTNTFGGSKDSVNTNTNTTPIDTSLITPDEAENMTINDSCNHSSNTMNRNTNYSNSNSNLYIGSNILRRFADRISGNTNLTTPKDPKNSTSIDVTLSSSIKSDK